MDKPNFGRNHRWKHLEHNGVAFPPPHVHRGIAITILGNRLVLDRDQEEVVYAWAKKKDTHYIKDPVFQLNFLNYFRKLLPDRFQSIKNISEIDMSEAFSLVDEESKAKEVEKERLRSLPKEERKRRSLERKAERENEIHIRKSKGRQYRSRCGKLVGRASRNFYGARSTSLEGTLETTC